MLYKEEAPVRDIAVPTFEWKTLMFGTSDLVFRPMANTHTWALTSPPQAIVVPSRDMATEKPA